MVNFFSCFWGLDPPCTHLGSAMPVLGVFLVETHKQNLLFSFNEKQHQVTISRYLGAMISDAAMPKKYCRVAERGKPN